MRIVPQSVTLEAITPNAALLIERAGRTCYKSEGKATEGSAGPFISRILDRQHESVIEHASATFRIVCDRGISHEIVRHRIASYSQESTRYCNYVKDAFNGQIAVIEPPGLTNRQRFEWEASCDDSEERYLRMINLGVKPEIARSVLPTCLKTELVVTMNFRAWRHFLKMRGHPAAHPQVREIAEMIRTILVEECPEVFK